MDSEPLVIDIESFLSLTATDDTRLLAIANELQTQYVCFKEDGVKKVYHPHAAKKHSMAEKPRIGMRDLSREAMARKDFLAMINKLSPQNLQAMTEQCKRSLRPEFVSLYVDMLWDAMLRSPDYQTLYASILHMIDGIQSVFGDVHRIWDEYITKKPWIPEDRGESYDEFCDQVKAKKRFIASVRGWMHLSQKGLSDPMLLEQLLRVLMNQEPTDAILEGLIELYKGVPSIFTAALPVLEDWHDKAQSFPPIIRFKLYDLWDVIAKK